MAIATCAYTVVISGCVTQDYTYRPIETTGIRDRAESQIEESVRVSAAVPGREETTVIFGVPLYDKGIQPVWLEIENNRPEQVRYAPVSTDRFYFSPFEAAYANRSGFSINSRVAMEKRFDELAMPRYVDPGETRSGFILTHADTGTKGFNVDLFSSGESFHFTFLLRVPGFVPDYANVDFDSIYEPEQIEALDSDDLQYAIRNLPCCNSDANGEETGDPINVVLIGKGEEVLYALLRSNWIETAVSESADKTPRYLFGRAQDAIFRYEKVADDSYYELRAWLAPIKVGEERVWAAQVRHFFRSALVASRLDPNVDNARDFIFQNFLYSQALEKSAWLAGTELVPAKTFWSAFFPPTSFSDGYRVVLWPSAEPFSMLDMTTLEWDDPPRWGE